MKTRNETKKCSKICKRGLLKCPGSHDFYLTWSSPGHFSHCSYASLALQSCSVLILGQLTLRQFSLPLAVTVGGSLPVSKRDRAGSWDPTKEVQKIRHSLFMMCPWVSHFLEDQRLWGPFFIFREHQLPLWESQGCSSPFVEKRKLLCLKKKLLWYNCVLKCP